MPAKHPLRVIKAIVDDALASLDADFERLYESSGRSWIAPERLLQASLLQTFYSVRSERQLVEQIDYNLLCGWIVGLGIDDAVCDHSTFSKNRDRLLEADVAVRFLGVVLRHPRVKQFLSDDNFSVRWPLGQPPIPCGTAEHGHATPWHHSRRRPQVCCGRSLHESSAA